MTYVQSKFFANYLTLKQPSSKFGVHRLGTSLLNATIDLNPHQVDGALFYFDNPLSKGIILADEVGLGKTIEGGLVLCQLWSEQKRKILLVVPASLRKQRVEELHSKFHMPAKILDGQIYRQMIQDGVENPFDQDAVIVCSYTFASSVNKEEYPYEDNINAIKRDVVVFDEAHKLRNVYKDMESDLEDFFEPEEQDEAEEKKISRASRLFERFKDTKKLLLTATPLQNSILELFGLMCFVDPYAFGDLDSFKLQYPPQKLTDSQLDELKSRIQPYVQRTLRRQVAEQINYTKRIAKTVEYVRSDKERMFYEDMSDFLRESGLFQTSNGRVNYLLMLVYWKLLASSTPAIVGTLKKLKLRLEVEKKELENKIRTQKKEELIDDDDIVSTYKTEAEESSNFFEDTMSSKIDELELQQIKEYLLSVKSFIERGEDIEEDAKAKALLQAISISYQELERTGANKKILIFTESRRTQDYLFNYLNKNGFFGKVICFNGDNKSPLTSRIYNEWKNKYEHTEYFSGSVPSDTRASLVDYFKSDAEIMIATESAAEGVNLQFCSLLINYDLPWNPQRVEQRIGRCHRYGQKFDVVVMNLINTANRADQRVYQLLRDKLQLFDGLFGSSDAVLGALESGINIEQTILEIMQGSRTSEEIEASFNTLQDIVGSDIEERLKQTKAKVIDRLDEDVVRRLKDKKEQSEVMLNELQTALLHLVCIEGGDAIEQDLSDGVIVKKPLLPSIKPGYYARHKRENAYLLRSEIPLGKFCIEQALSRDVKSQELIFDLSNHPGKISILEDYVGTSGYLQVVKLIINAYENEEYLLYMATDENGNILDTEVAKKLIWVSGKLVGDCEMPSKIQSRLEEELYKLEKEATSISQELNESYFDTELDKLDNWAEDLKRSLEKKQKLYKQEIRQMKKEVRKIKNLQEKVALQRKIKNKEKKLATMRAELFDLEDRIDKQKENLIDEIEKRLEAKSRKENLFTIKRELI